MTLQEQLEAAIRRGGGDFSQACTAVCGLLDHAMSEESTAWMDDELGELDLESALFGRTPTRAR